MNKRTGKTKQIKQEKKLKGKNALTAPDEIASDFDFGGLPKIDLKKNLGCG